MAAMIAILPGHTTLSMTLRHSPLRALTSPDSSHDWSGEQSWMRFSMYPNYSLHSNPPSMQTGIHCASS